MSVIGSMGSIVEQKDPQTTTHMEEFEVLAHGCFEREAVLVEYRRGCSLPVSPFTAALIDRTWLSYVDTSSAAGINVYNGALFRLDCFRNAGGRLVLELSDTDFRECIGTAGREFASVFPDLPRANPVAVSAALVTSDRKIIVEKRSRVDSRRRPYHVIAGYMERDRDGETPHPFATLRREVHEELGIDLDEAALRVTGLIRALYASEVCFRCPLPVSFEEVAKMQDRVVTDSEIEALEPLDDSPGAVAAFLAAHPSDMAPPGRACLLLYGRNAYGDEWYRAARR
jgi:8-oxo-dGTP pyrophosphatase MutT (NUDIX family)